MKIAVLSSHTPSLLWFRMDMMRAFQEKGHEVVAIGNEPEFDWKAKFAKEGIRYREIQVQRNGTNPLKDVATLKSIKCILFQEKPDKIFTYQAKTVIYGGIAARKLGITEVYPLIAGVGSIFLDSSIKNLLLQLILTVEYKIALKNSVNIFFQNRDDYNIFLRKKVMPKNKVVFINGSGINVEAFKPTPLPDKTTFLCVSRLIRDKGIGEYLASCQKIKQRYPDIRCLLVGPFDSNPSALSPEELQPYIDDGVIEYFGEQPDVRPYLEQCSVFVLPSYHEGTPKTVLEAMASGRAVITTNAPGCRETVKDGVNGYLVPVKEIDALVTKMEKLISAPKLVQQMAVKGRNIAINKYDVSLVNKMIITTMKL